MVAPWLVAGSSFETERMWHFDFSAIFSAKGKEGTLLGLIIMQVAVYDLDIISYLMYCLHDSKCLQWVVSIFLTTMSIQARIQPC